METDKLFFGKNYEGGLTASIDWVGGGNLDGYITRNILKFDQLGNTVTKSMIILDNSRHEGEILPHVRTGTFSETDKKTITCVFDNHEMKGKILGENNQFIAFEVKVKSSGHFYNECYELKT